MLRDIEIASDIRIKHHVPLSSFLGGCGLRRRHFFIPDAAEQTLAHTQLGLLACAICLFRGGQPSRPPRLVASQTGGLTGWWLPRLVASRDGGLTGWWPPRLVVSQTGGLCGWLPPRLVASRDGGLTGWWLPRLVASGAGGHLGW